MVDASRRMRDKIVGEVLRHARGEEAAMRIFKITQLRDYGGDYIGMRMAKTRNRRPAGGIDVFLAIRVLDQDSLAADRNGVIVIDLSVKDVRHYCRAFRRGNVDMKSRQPKPKTCSALVPHSAAVTTTRIRCFMPSAGTQSSSICGYLGPMSAFGTKRTSRHAQSMSALGVKRTSCGRTSMSADDPKRTWQWHRLRTAPSPQAPS